MRGNVLAFEGLESFGPQCFEGPVGLGVVEFFEIHRMGANEGVLQIGKQQARGAKHRRLTGDKNPVDPKFLGDWARMYRTCAASHDHGEVARALAALH